MQPPTAQIPNIPQNANKRSNMDLVERVFRVMDSTNVVEKLNERYTTGRRGYSKDAMWRALVAHYILKCRYTNDLIRYLEDNDRLRELCGFKKIPSASTFCRFRQRLTEHQSVIDDAMLKIVDELHNALPEFGETVAIDATAIKTYSNPKRTEKSDPDARFGRKHSSNNPEKKSVEWFFGYKAHIIADANYGIPMSLTVTAGNSYDSTKAIPLFQQIQNQHDWFAPKTLIADRGYDAKSFYNFLHQQGVDPVIKARDMRRTKNGEKQLIQGIWDQHGNPYCKGGLKMEYVGSDPKRGYRFRCPNDGCSAPDRQLMGCQVEFWQKPEDNIRLFGKPRRESDEWKAIYTKRYAVERPFKSGKQSRALEHHAVRGLNKMTLHVKMSFLTFNATVLANHRAGTDLMWMVPRVS